MENILHLYGLPYDPRRPLVCFGERPRQLIEDVLVPLPMEPGKTKREDCHYKRNGACTVFVAFEPITSRRVVQVRQRRTKKDYAEFIQGLAESHYPSAEKIVLVQDNLNTHSPGSFCEAFDPDEVSLLLNVLRCTTRLLTQAKARDKFKRFYPGTS